MTKWIPLPVLHSLVSHGEQGGILRQTQIQVSILFDVPPRRTSDPLLGVMNRKACVQLGPLLLRYCYDGLNIIPFLSTVLRPALCRICLALPNADGRETFQRCAREKRG